MSGKQDLVVKMTINSQDFDAGLKNSKSEMKRTESTAAAATKSMKAAFTSVAAAIGVAKVGLEAYKKVMRSTEQGADAMDRSMHALTVTTNKFFQSLANGSFNDFLNGLSDITKNAKEAYDALDKLGTMKMWSTARVAQLQAQIAEDRVIVNSGTTTAAQKKEAQDRINLNLDTIKALTGDVVDATIKAQKAKLRELSGAGKDITDAMLESYVQMFEGGTLASEAQQFFQQHSRQQLHSYTVGNAEGMPAYEQQYYTTEWDTELNRQIYNAMHALATLREAEGGWQDYYKLLEEEAAQRTNLANQERKLLKTTEGGTGGGGTTAKSGGLTWEQQMEMIRRSSFFEALNSDRMKDSQIIPLEELIEDEEIFEADTEAVVAAYWARQEAMAALNEEVKIGIQTFAAFGSIMTSIGTIADSDMFTKIGQSLSSIASQASSTISTLMALSGAQTIEGITETFSSAPPFTKIAMTATALAGILGMVATAKSAFAGSYANGGIVPGTSYTGDKLWARVNSGERILTQQQWAGLTSGGTVKFVIEGSQLKGVLDNYESIEAM